MLYDVSTDGRFGQLVLVLQVKYKLHHLGFVGDDDQLLSPGAVSKRRHASREPALRCLVGQSAVQPKLDHRTLVLGCCGQYRTGERTGRIFDVPAVEHVVLGRHDRVQPHAVPLKHRDEQLLLIIDASQSIELPDDQMQWYGFTQVFPRLLQVHEQGQQHRARSRCRHLLLFWSTRKLDHPQRFGCACHLVDKLWGVHFLV